MQMTHRVAKIISVQHKYQQGFIFELLRCELGTMKSFVIGSDC